MSFLSFALGAASTSHRAASAMLVAVLLSACGGGAPLGSAEAQEADLDSPTAKILSVQADAQTDWTACASEGARCSFEGTRMVRYGAVSNQVVVEATNGTACTNEVFGDPAWGVTKTCSYGPLAGAPTAVSAAAITAWTDCATEGQTCRFTGTRIVRYGTGTRVVHGTYVDQVACTNAVFGDPAYGVSKTCAYGTPPPATPATPAASPALDVASWTSCAVEGQACAFTGSRLVRYGTGTRYFQGTFTDRVGCTNDVFGDPAIGVIKQCFFAGAAAVASVSTPAPASTTISVPASVPVVASPAGANASAGDTAAGTTGGKAVITVKASSAADAPIVLNAPASSRPGDVVGLHGVNFGTTAQVWLDGALGSRQLVVMNRVGGNYVAARIPADASGALVVRVVVDALTSGQVKLNAAVAHHLDAMTLAPGGAFRVFGRNLVVADGKPSITVNGLPAAVDLAQSTEHMLVATAPASLTSSRTATIVVDNGNGAGAATLDRTIDIATIGSGDPFGLGVGWAAAYSTYSNRTISAGTDTRLPRRMRCDGVQDDSPALQAAVDLAASSGGGVVRVPAGNCRLGNGIGLKSNVVIDGAGKTATVLLYQSNYPLSGTGIDLAGVRNLSLTNNGNVREGPLLKDSARVFLQNVAVDMGRSRLLFLSGNRNFVVANTDITQSGGLDENGPYTVHGSSGLVFTGNVTRWVQGASTFGSVHDAYIAGNRFVRDGSFQQASGTVHSFTLDFAHRVAVVGNSFEVANGPIRNKTRNDGETILTEGGGGSRTENIGTVTSATPTSVTDTGNRIDVDPFRLGNIVENYGVAIVSGKGAGQSRRVMSYENSTLTVDTPWLVVPDSTSRYATFVWGLEKSLIEGNRLSQNPRGIWIYHTAARDVDIVSNQISEGGGIYLRSYVNVSTRSFMPIWNLRIAGNKVSNSTGDWMSYIDAHLVNPNADSFGIGILGLEVRDNELVANTPSQTSSFEEYANLEGYVSMMRIESGNAYRPVEVQLLGTVFQRNACDRCDAGFRVGTAAGGTVITGSKVTNAKLFLEDWATTNDGTKSTHTVVD